LFSHTLTNVSFLCLTFCPSKVSNSNHSNDQPAGQSISHSEQNALSSLFSILPTAADVGNPNPEEELPFRKLKKKKKKGRSPG